MTTIIKVEEPDSGVIMELKVKPVDNFAFPGWVVLIPEGKNILLFQENGQWHIIPEAINPSYKQRIVEKLVEQISYFNSWSINQRK